MNRLREKLGAIAEERSGLEGRLAELAGGEERIRWLDELPTLVEEHLRDLPHLVGRERVVRECETVPPERIEDNPLGLYELTPESIRYLGEEERSARFRELYEMLNLEVVCHKDRSLEVTWGADCSKWLSPG